MRFKKRIHKNSSRAQSLINPRNAFPAAQLQNIAVCGVFMPFKLFRIAKLPQLVYNSY